MATMALLQVVMVALAFARQGEHQQLSDDVPIPAIVVPTSGRATSCPANCGNCGGAPPAYCTTHCYNGCEQCCAKPPAPPPTPRPPPHKYPPVGDCFFRTYRYGDSQLAPPHMSTPQSLDACCNSPPTSP